MLEQARLEISRKFPFLSPAVARLAPLDSEEYRPAAVDGNHFFCALEGRSDGARLLFHGLCHCLLGHIFLQNPSDLFCDLAVALLAAEIAPEYFPAHGNLIFQELRRRCMGEIQAENLERMLAEDPFFNAHRAEIMPMIAADDHRPWIKARGAALRCGGSGLADFWRVQKKRMQAGLGGRRIGLEAGAHREKMALGEGARHEFAQYLRRYAVEREYAREDPDSYQAAWYIYGLEHYGNMPLIEPAETREERRLEELVIAIDTSGSCERGLTRQFLEQTRNILLKEGLFFQRFNLHIMQCDAKLQRDDKITNLREFERYIANLEVCGGGGTDFRPVFERIDALIAKGELRNLKGMLYFTDGRGIYPAAPAKYEATFVFLEHRYDDIDTPRWIKRLILEAPMPRGDEYMEY